LVGRLNVAVTQGSQAEALERLGVELQGDPLALRQKPALHRPVKVRGIGKAVVALLRRQLTAPEATLLDIALQLLRIGCPLALCGAILASETCQGADAGSP